jgi:hypothetical protein
MARFTKVEVLPGQREPRIVGKLLEEGALGPAVSLAERVDGVDLTEVIDQPVDECGGFTERAAAVVITVS